MSEKKLRGKGNMYHLLPKTVMRPSTQTFNMDEFKSKVVEALRETRPEIEKFEKRRAESLSKANLVVRWK